MPENKRNEVEYNLKRIVKYSVFVLLGIIISKISLYIFRVIVARYFGPEIYGVFSLALMILTLFVSISALGLSEGILRYVAIYRGKKQIHHIRYATKIVVYVSIISSIIAAVLLFFLSGFISDFFHDSRLIVFLKISSVIVPFLVLSGVCLSIIRAYEKIVAYSFLINILQNVSKLIILIVLIALGLNSNSIMVSFFFGVFLMFVVSYYICLYRIPGLFSKHVLKPDKKKKIVSDIFSYSYPLFFTSILITFYYWIDSFIIGYFKGTAAVGIYNAALPIAMLFTVAPDLFIQIFFPMITKEYSRKNFPLIKELSNQISKWIFIINIPFFIIIFIFPGAVINILFGSQYLSAQTALRILSIGSIISILSSLFSSLLLMAGKSKFVLINFITTSIINIILDLLLVPKYGINGAAIATTCVWLIFTIILAFELKKTLDFIPFKKDIFKVFLLSLIPTALLIFIKSFLAINIYTLIILGSLFLLVYVIIILLSHSLDKNDLMIINAIKKKLGFNFTNPFSIITSS